MTGPANVEPLYHQGVELYRLGRYDAAAEIFGKAIALEPGSASLHNVMGLALNALGCRDAALQSYDTAVRLDPKSPPPHINRGIVLRDMGRLDAALASLDRAVALAPDSPNAHGNRGSVLTELNQPVAAIASIDRALHLNPAYPFLRGIRLMNKIHICEWTNLGQDVGDLLARVARGEPATPPWPLLALTDSAPLQRQAAEVWLPGNCPENPALGPLEKYPRRERIKLGYYSADFHRHATAHLIAELFERHDRTRFELIAFSFGPQTGDDMQRRLIAGCDRFIDVRSHSDRDVATLSRELQIDVAIDLKGLTAANRLGIFAQRAAPIQVNYLAYPGTVGAPYMDYIIADKTVIPATAHRLYAEKIITLPHSYQVNDTRRKAGVRDFTRSELGLPEAGFVFCCFNNNFKITPSIFDIWMRLLKAVDGSVLWLIEDNSTAAANLRREAASRGIDPTRLVFAARVASEDHLARQRAADLFLDTFPYNAHTTASDALWIGLPLLTCLGESFAARVAASLLQTMDVPELIAPTLQDYETLAVALATQPDRLRDIKQKLARNRAVSRLFDIETFTYEIETAYTRIYDNHHAGRPPEALSLS